jgi:hypothetical protein
MVETAHKPQHSRPRKRRRELWIVSGVLVVLAGALLYAARDLLTASEVAPASAEIANSVADVESSAKPQAMPAVASGQTAEAGSDLVDDDGETLWASPTHGPPLDLTFLHAGTEIVLALRPAELLVTREGEKSLAALGPLGQSAIDAVERTTGLSLSEIEQLIIGWRRGQNGDIVCQQLVRIRDAIAPESLRDRLEKHIPYSSNGDQAIVFAQGRAYYKTLPSNGATFVESPIEAFAELFPQEPLLPRDVGRLVRQSDSTRDVTLIFRPQFLFSDQNHFFTGQWAPMQPVLEHLLGNDVAAASISVDWGDNLFVELVAMPTLDSSPAPMSDEFAARVNALPAGVEEFVLGLNASPFSRRVVARLPEMVRKLATYTRHGFDRDAAILRCYLPVTAGHNLLMATELALAEGLGAGNSGATRAAVPPTAEANVQTSIAERLQKKTSLRFGREELEAALNMLAQDIGVPIVIRGPDLQLDGITRNQLFGIDMADQSGEAILVEILRRANPDKLAAGPADPRQKLVYVVGPESIFITTRAKAAERGDPLPAVFQEAR